jgi:hypothetical protein
MSTPEADTMSTTVETPAAEDVETTVATATDEHASREAANYRRRLRDTEAERDALRCPRRRVRAPRRRRRRSRAGRGRPVRLWTLVQLDELRVDGVLDVEAARTRITDVLRDRPTWRRTMPPVLARKCRSRSLSASRPCSGRSCADVRRHHRVP